MPKATTLDQEDSDFMFLANVLIRFKNNPEGLVSDYVGEIMSYYDGKSE